MPRVPNCGACDDDSFSDYSEEGKEETVETTEAPERTRSQSKGRRSTVKAGGFPGVNSQADRLQEEKEKESQQDRRRFLLLSGQVVVEEKNHNNNNKRTIKAYKESNEFGVGTHGEADQEREKIVEQTKEPRYGRKEKEIQQPLKRKESVYDRLRRSDSTASMKNLTNGAVADRTQRRSTVSKSADDAAMFGDIPKVRSPTKLPSLQSEGKRSTFYDSRNTSGVDDSVNTSPPPPPPPREEKGGVVDTFGYFSTHRVHPNYYNELERTSKTTNYYEKRSTSRSQSVHSNHGKATVRGFTGKRDLLDEEQPAPRYSTQRSKSMNSNASNTNSSRGQSVTAAQS